MESLLDYRNEFEQWASYVRSKRNDVDNDKTYLYDKFCREFLNYLRTHRVKEVEVFLAREGKEYPVMLIELERLADGDVADFITEDFLKMTYDLAQKWKRL